MSSLAPLDAVLARLRKVKKAAGGWIACCPAHDDRNPSLSIRVGSDGRVLLFCHAGCSPEAVVSAMGLRMSDLFEPKTRTAAPHMPRRVYTPHESLVPDKQRFRDLEREADFGRHCRGDLNADEDVLAYLWQRRGIGPATACAWGVGATKIRRNASGKILGVTWTLPIMSHLGARPLIGIKLHRDPPRGRQPKGGWYTQGGAALFPLPEAQGLSPASEIVLCEGELKALAYLEAGIAATSPATGSSQPWTREMSARFRGLAVVLDPDREESKAAETFVENATRALFGVARSVEICYGKENDR